MTVAGEAVTLPGAAPDVPLPEASVIVPHFRDYARLDKCLAALAGQSYAGRFEIIVADNASPEGVDEVRRVVAGRAQVVVQPERGAGPARNRGVAAAAGRILAFTDSDCVPHCDWLAEGLRTVAADTIVGGKVEVMTRAAVKSPTEAFEIVFAFDNETYVREKGFSITANLFVARDVFARVGPFRTGVSEDIEWCWRARAAGVAIDFAPRAVVDHPARHDVGELDQKWRRLSHELFLLDMGRGKSIPWFIARTWLMLLDLPRGLVRVARSPMLHGAAERFGAASVLAGNRWFRFVENHRLAFAHARRGDGRSAQAARE